MNGDELVKSRLAVEGYDDGFVGLLLHGKWHESHEVTSHPGAVDGPGESIFPRFDLHSGAERLIVGVSQESAKEDMTGHVD